MKRLAIHSFAGVLVFSTGLAPSVEARSLPGDGDTERVSVDSAGNQGTLDSDLAACSTDGRYVAFESYAANLVAGDTNFAQDVFVRDRQTGVTTRVSVSSAGVQGNSNSYEPDISGDGRFVTFTSIASNLVAADYNLKSDVFLHDRQTGVTTRISEGVSGAEVKWPSDSCRISTDGAYVVFVSSGNNLVPSGAFGTHVYWRDLASGSNELVSMDSSGVPGDGVSGAPAISDNGVVVFESLATNLVPGDTNGVSDVFVRDMPAGTTTRASVSSVGVEGNNYSVEADVSADGSRVAFTTRATNLTPNLFGHDTVLLHDRTTGQTTIVSVDLTGTSAATWFSYDPSISADGNRIAFHSRATDLVEGDTNLAYDVFVRDVAAATTVRVSVDSADGEVADDSFDAAISGDGEIVAFTSEATTLVVGDTNGADDVFAHEYAPAPGPPAAPTRQVVFASSESFVSIAAVQPAGVGRAASASYAADMKAGLAAAGSEGSSSQYVARARTAAIPAQLSSSRPLVFGVAPALGHKDGGEPVAVHGFELDDTPGVASVLLADQPATSVSTTSNTVLSATSAAGLNEFANPLGRGNVEVTTSAGTGALADGFVYGPALSEEAPPQVGAPYAVDLHLHPGDFYLLALGASVPGLAVPVPPFAGAAEILLGVKQLVGLTLAPEGMASFGLPVPADASLIGATVEFQALALTSLAPLAGSFTNRLETTIQP